MIQGGGDLIATCARKGHLTPIENEAANGLKNETGTLLHMARLPNPHSASAQFFINVKDNDMLNYREATPQGYGYAVFGRVTQGMDVVMKIAQSCHSPRSVNFRMAPREPVVIQSASAITAK